MDPAARLDEALREHFLLIDGQGQSLLADYLERCKVAAEPAIIINTDPPASLTIHLEPTGKRLNEARRQGLEQLLRQLSAPNAIVAAGPGAGRTDWLVAQPAEAASRVVGYLAETQPEELDTPYVSEPAPDRLRPRPTTFNEWLNNTVDNFASFLEFVEEMLARRFP